MKSANIKTRLIAPLSSLLLIVFVIISTANYTVSKKFIRDNIIQDLLPLISNNVCSELQKVMATPIHISSLMANDTFVKDRVTGGELPGVAGIGLEMKKAGATGSVLRENADYNQCSCEAHLKKNFLIKGFHISGDQTENKWILRLNLFGGISSRLIISSNIIPVSQFSIGFP